MKQIVLAFFCISFILNSSSGQLSITKTDELNLVSYNFGHKYILPHSIRCFYNALDFHKELFQYKPSEKIMVLIQDFGDYGNAGATAIPKNAISMGLSPFSYAFETSPAGERVYSMMNHELVHVVALDNYSSADRFWRGLFFGKVKPTSDHPISMIYGLLTSPRRYSPRWYHEGIASYLDTWMSGGIGLALSSYDEMVFRTKVYENARIYSAQGLESEGVTSDFQGRTNSYLYGTRFMGFLALQYGPEKLIDWVNRTNGTKRLYAPQFKKVFGKSISDGWDEWINFEKEWQDQNISIISENPVTEFKEITNKTLGSVSYPHYDKKRNKVYLAINYPGQVPHLAALNLTNGKLEKLIDIKGAALFYVSSVAYDEASDVIYFTTDNDAWRDLNSYHIKSKKKTLLQKDFRTGDLCFNKIDSSIWGIKHLNGISTIVRIPEYNPKQPDADAFSSWIQVHTLNYGEDIFDIDISPDGKILSAAVSDLRGYQSLLLYDIPSLLDGNPSIDTVYNFEVSSPQGFRFTEDGKNLIGSSYYSGVSNIFRVDMNTLDISALSNALTGFFRPIEIDEDKLFVFNFTSNGFQPVFIKNEEVPHVSAISYIGNEAINKHDILKKWEAPMPSSKEINAEEKIISTEDYKPFKELNVNYAYPTVVGYKDHVGLGYKMNISDPFNFKEIELSFAYTPKSWHNGLTGESPEYDLPADEQYHASLFIDLGKYSIDANYNGVDFYDLFGPTKSSRKGINVGINRSESLIWDPPINLNLNLGISGYYGLDQSPDFQQIELAGYDKNFFLNLYGQLSYRNQSFSLGAVDSEKGIGFSIKPSLAYSAKKLYPRVTSNLDYGIQLPFPHTSVWLRSAFGYSFSDQFNPFTRFGFAAFGNNYVDYLSTRRYRSSYSFPGLSFDADKIIIAREYAKLTAELVLPPIRFRKFGSFNLYSNWIQPTIFSSGLVSNDPTTGKNKFVNLGAQLDMRLVILSILPSTISVGYAQAWDIDTNQNYSEWMISLKLLR